MQICEAALSLLPLVVTMLLLRCWAQREESLPAKKDLLFAFAKSRGVRQEESGSTR